MSKLKDKMATTTMLQTQAVKFVTAKMVNVDLNLSEFSAIKVVT